MTTLAYSIATGADDGVSVTVSGTYSTVNLTNPYWRAGCINNRGTQNSYWGGTRFQAVAMPNGQAVDSADIEIYLLSPTSGTANYDIYGDDLDDAPNVFSGTTPNRPGLPADVTETTAVYSYTGGTDDTTENKTVDTIVNEICARAGWVNGNDMRFAWEDTIGTATTNFIEVAALEHTTQAEPILNIIYTLAAGVDVSVPLATLAITEQTPTVARTDNHVISVPVDTLTVSEQTPTVARTDNHIITVPVDTLTISAQTPTVDVAANKTISVPVDILTVVANAPTVVRTDYQVVAVPVAALTLTPATPTVTIPVTYNQVSFRVYLDDGTSLGA